MDDCHECVLRVSLDDHFGMSDVSCECGLCVFKCVFSSSFLFFLFLLLFFSYLLTTNRQTDLSHDGRRHDELMSVFQDTLSHKSRVSDKDGYYT